MLFGNIFGEIMFWETLSNVSLIVFLYGIAPYIHPPLLIVS